MIILLVMRPLESSFLKIVFLFIAIPECSWASMMARRWDRRTVSAYTSCND
jgi:hypothetical protein